VPSRMGTKRKRDAPASNRVHVRAGHSCFFRDVTIKECQGDDLGELRDQAVLVSGIGPEWMGKKEIEETLQKHFGKIHKVAIHPEQKSAIVIFESSKSVKKILSSRKKSFTVLDPPQKRKADQGIFGLLKDYRKARPGNKTLLSAANASILAIEAREERERKAREEAAASDGWTVVTSRKGRDKNRDASGNVNVSAVAKAAAEGKRKEASVFKDLYRFQQREARRSEILELQHKFKQDKQRVAELRSKRKFNPYG